MDDAAHESKLRLKLLPEDEDDIVRHLYEEEESPVSDEVLPPPKKEDRKRRYSKRASSSKAPAAKRTVKSSRNQPRYPLGDARKKRLTELAEQGKGEDDELSDENNLNVVRREHHRMQKISVPHAMVPPRLPEEKPFVALPYYTDAQDMPSFSEAAA